MPRKKKEVATIEPIRDVDLLREKSESLTRSVWASIQEDGSLFVGGQDSGPFKQEWLGGGESYEYSATVSPEYRDTVLLLLIKERFKDYPEFEQWLKEQGIPYSDWVWS
jgi:hypothetical protein